MANEASAVNPGILILISSLDGFGLGAVKSLGGAVEAFVSHSSCDQAPPALRQVTRETNVRLDTLPESVDNGFSSFLIAHKFKLSTLDFHR